MTVAGGEAVPENPLHAGEDEAAAPEAPGERPARGGRAASRTERRRQARREQRRESTSFKRIRGRRSARLAADRHRRRSRRRGLLVVCIVVVLGAVLAAGWLLRPEPEVAAPADEEAAPIAGEDGYTLLLVRHGEGVGTASSATLLAGGRSDGPSLVLFLPVGTLVDIPGVGTDRLGLAYQYGGAALLHATVENVLGVAVDEIALVDDSGLGAFLDRLGGLPIEVPGRLVTWRADGSAEVRFEPGRQFLDGARLAEYWGFRARGEDELAALSRQQRVLEAVVEAASEPEVADDLLADGAPQLDTAADAGWLRELFVRLSAAQDAGELRFALLPVEPFGGDGPDGGATFRVRQAALEELVSGPLAASVPGDGLAPVRIQVLNGVGVPGVGQQVDERLDRGQFRIVVTDNARHFDFTETQILVYDESDASLAAARRVREQLGVGTIQVSRQPQSVVDLTIVVGADFFSVAGGGESGS